MALCTVAEGAAVSLGSPLEYNNPPGSSALAFVVPVGGHHIINRATINSVINSKSPVSDYPGAKHVHPKINASYYSLLVML
jgi:hypothetical protein